MPVEDNSAIFLAHRYVLLTQNLIETVRLEAFQDLPDLFEERDKVLDVMTTLEIDRATDRILADAEMLERELQLVIAGHAAEVKEQLLGRFQEKKGLGGYRSKERATGGTQDAIA